MAEAGAVAWQFDKKGLLVIEDQPVTEEQLFDLALEAGAEDVKQTPNGFEVISEPATFEAVKEAIQKAQIETSLSELTFLPQNHANFEISDELMEKMAAESA
jgi:transcriptional/translational regulatory protein YebC/TACO1